MDVLLIGWLFALVGVGFACYERGYKKGVALWEARMDELEDRFQRGAWPEPPREARCPTTE